jgi:hypothetical protein
MGGRRERRDIKEDIYDLFSDTYVTPEKKIVVHRKRRTAIGHDNATGECQVVPGDPWVTDNKALVAEGPGFHCTGDNCAKDTIGMGAGVGCSGPTCATGANGLFAGAVCVGDNCAEGANGTMAGAMCWGENCAKDATGNFSGAWCIGNGCASGVITTNGGGHCCIGIECNDGSLVDTCSDEANAGVPAGLGATPATSLYGASCRREINTTTSEWRNFTHNCARMNDATTTYTPNLEASCVLTCNDDLHKFLRYYIYREAAYSYYTAVVASPVKFSSSELLAATSTAAPASSSSTSKRESDAVISAAVLGGLVGIIAIVGLGYWISGSSMFASSGASTSYASVNTESEMTTVYDNK